MRMHEGRRDQRYLLARQLEIVGGFGGCGHGQQQGCNGGAQ
jgi:hypothetical protein